MESLTKTRAMDRSRARPSIEDAMSSEDSRLDELSIAESRSRYETRSMSMPAIKPWGESASVEMVKAAIQHNFKLRQELRLPSFKALGIAVPHPDQLLTPPEEPDQMAWYPNSQSIPYLQNLEIPRSVPVPTARMTPEDEQVMTAPFDSEGVDTEQITTSVSGPLAVVEEDSSSRPSSSSSEDDSPGGPVWIEHAIDAVGELTTAPNSTSFPEMLC